MRRIGGEILGGNIEILVTAIAAFLSGGGLIKLMENQRLAKTDKRDGDHKLIDQLQEQMGALGERISVLETKNETMALKITELEKDNVRLETENKYLKKEIDTLKGVEEC